MPERSHGNRTPITRCMPGKEFTADQGRRIGRSGPSCMGDYVAFRQAQFQMRRGRRGSVESAGASTCLNGLGILAAAQRIDDHSPGRGIDPPGLKRSLIGGVRGAGGPGCWRYAGCMRYAHGGGLTAEARKRRERVRLAAVERFEQRVPVALPILWRNTPLAKLASSPGCARRRSAPPSWPGPTRRAGHWPPSPILIPASSSTLVSRGDVGPDRPGSTLSRPGLRGRRRQPRDRPGRDSSECLPALGCQDPGRAGANRRRPVRDRTVQAHPCNT